MSRHTIEIDLPPSTSTVPLIDQTVSQVVVENRERLADAASVWARLHYEHASYVEDSLSLRRLDLDASGSGKVLMNFDWTMQDG